MSHHIIFLCIALSGLVACSSVPSELNEPRNDKQTDAMIVPLRSPIVFSRQSPELSATGRDFLYLAPVEANQAGHQQLYLWVGFASTIDRRVARALPPTIEAIEFRQGEQVLRLPLKSWQGSVKEQPVTTRLTVKDAMRTSLSSTDFETLSTASDLSIKLIDEQRRGYQYGHWSGNWPEWSDIARDTRVGVSVKISQRE